MVSPFTPTMIYSLATGPKAMEPKNHELKTPKQWAKINFSF
jgi:hypothetical protein